MGVYGNLQVTLKVGGCAGAPWLRGCDSRFGNGVGIRSGRDYHQEQGTLQLVTFLISKGKNKWEVSVLEAEIRVGDESTRCWWTGSQVCRTTQQLFIAVCELSCVAFLQTVTVNYINFCSTHPTDGRH